MKTITCSLSALLCAVSMVATGATPPAVQKPLEVSAQHLPIQVMGRDYWTYLGSGVHNDPGYWSGLADWNNPWNNASLTNLPVFRDSGLVRHSLRLPPDAKGTSASWRTVQENHAKITWDVLTADVGKTRPFVQVFDSKRNVLAMAGDVNLDHADWAAFKREHPNLVGTRTMCEWGNDMLLLIPRTTNVLNEVRRKELEAVWAKYSLTNRDDRLALCRWYTDRKLKLHYDDMDTFMAFRGMYCLDHIAAAWGAKTLTAETTNTSGGDSEYRWDISGMFVRGAARQFGLPWCWYEANYFNGPGKDGKWQNNSVCRYRNPRGTAQPEGGTSVSAQRRCWYYAYLNGANAVEPESWFGQFFTTNTFTGKAELSDRGKNFSDFHDFTAAHPGRGVTYAPVAILTPFAQGYTAHGGAPWGRCAQTDGDYALNALFFTIAPGWERAKGLRAGIQEGNLHNSRFAMMYDVLVPDSPQPKEAFAKALFAYPAAILAGDYPDPSKFEDVLAAYEKAGGRLIRLKPDELPPRKPNTQADMYAGRLKFPSIEKRLEALQRDLFPFAVEGDCQFGANRTKNGWWLWVFNNKGVRKFADTFETIDHSKDATVSVTFTKTAVAPVTELMTGRRMEVAGGKFTFTVPAGDFAIFEIGEGAEFAVPRAEFAKYYTAVTGKVAPEDAVRFAIDPKVSKSGKDAYKIVSGSAVTITGSNMRSVMYGVYDLLERRAGCRWFWDGDVVPRKDSIDLSGLDIYEEAQFEWRGLRYFAHRGLTRFQAEHWGPEDWKKEIDWMLKRRLNVFMLRIGQDDLFQRTFPDVCAYPDPSKPLPGAGKGYDDRSLFWPLKFRGDLRRDLQRYAFARGLEVPEDFGTMTHWYSRTPEDFLAKKNPEFLPQATKGYSEKNGRVWDIRDDKWVDEYWKLTKTAVEAYGKPGPGFLHTIGLGERLCYTNRADNLKLKLLALDKFLSRAHRDYPEKKVLLAGWDFYFTWYPDEVKELVKTLDPKRDIIWDYEGDATRDYRPEMKKIGGNDFTKWGVVGKFPYTYSIFLAFEDGIDIRANYPLIETRQKIVQNDPACAGYILWPESSHTDTLCLRYFTANAWAKDAVPVKKVLDEFCGSRYGARSAQMKRIWDKVLPAARLREWGGNYGRFVARGSRSLPPEMPEIIAKWKGPVEAVQPVFKELADVKWDDPFIRRDTIDLARTALDRVITLRLYELERDVAAWQKGESQSSTLSARAKNVVALMDLMADTLALHTDYSLWESYCRLDAVEKVQNPDFTKTLFDNASCGYCRSHQYELARHWYAARMRKAADRLEKAVAANDRKAVLFDSPEEERKALMARPLKSLRPVLPRTASQYRATMLGIARTLSGNLLRNPEFVSKDGIAPDGWGAGRSEKLKGAFTCTGGVLRISACAPEYCHGVSQTVLIDGTKSHWFEADIKCDALEYYGNVRYTLLDAKGKELVSSRPLLHPHFMGPQRKWFRVGLPIPAQEIERTRKLKLTFSVYNKSRKPAEDLALYIRNPSLSVYSGQTYRPLPPCGSRASGKLPAQPFPRLMSGRKVYCLEKGGVGYLSLNSALIPRGKKSELKVEAPDGVTYELHLRNIKVLRKLFKREETEKGLFKLPDTVNWAVGGNTLLFAAEDKAPSKFTLKLTLKVAGETRVVDVPVEIIQGPPPGKLPKRGRYRSWNYRPLVEIDQKTSPLGKALADYWQATGLEMKQFANITSVFPYRDDLKNPLARKAVGPHGTPTGIPCDSDLQAKGAAYYRDRLKSAGLEKTLSETEMAIWDYEPYVVGPVTVGCFCEDCRRAFAKEMGLSETPSSETILKSYVKDWVPFRCRQRAASVKVAVEGLKMLAPKVKFGLCTMPMAPDYGDKNAEMDFGYWQRFGIDSPLYEDFTDAFCSMSYTPNQTYFRSLEREVHELKKPKLTLLENGWGEPRKGAIVGLQLFGAFFAGLERPFIAQGLDISDGDQLSEIRRALQLVAETESLWEGARLCKDKCKTEVSDGLEARFWSMDREAKDGTRYVLAANSSVFGPVTVKITAPWGASQTLDLPSCSYRLLTFKP